MKRITSSLLALLLALSMLIGMVPAAYAATADTVESINSTETVDSTETEDVSDESEDVAAQVAGGTDVAAVGGVGYPTLAAAIDAATASATVTLLADTTVESTLTISKALTLDLNGNTLTVSTNGDGISVEDTTLTLTNSGSTGKYVFNCSASGSDGIFVSNTTEGTVTTLNINSNVEISTTSSVNSAIHAYASNGSAVVNMNDGKIAVSGNGQFSAVIADQNSTVNVNGGEFDLNVDFDSYSDSNDVVGVLAWGQNGVQKNIAVNIKGGIFKVGGKNAFAQAVQVGMKNGASENVTVNISGGNVILNPTDGGKGFVYAPFNSTYATATMTGGSVSGNVTALTITNKGEDTADLSVSGGTFATTADTQLSVEKYVAEGSTYDPETGTVTSGTSTTAITTSEQLIAAIAAANDGDTITLGEGEFSTYRNTSPNKSLTFVGSGAGTIWTIGDLNKHTKGEANGDYSFDGCNTITFKSMKLRSDSDDYRGFIRVTNTVVEDCVLDGKTAYWGYTTASFKDCTFNAPTNDYAIWDYSSPSMTFDNCTFNGDGKAVNVYVEQPSSTERKIEIKNCKANFTKDNKSLLNIKNSNQAWDVALSGTNTVTVNGEAVADRLYQVELPTISEKTGETVKVQEEQTDGTYQTVFETTVKSDAAAKIGEKEYESLEAALKDVTLETPLTWVSDTAWPAATPVYYDGTFYATIGELLYDAQQKKGVITPEANVETAVIYCRPGATIATRSNGDHPSYVTSTTIYGNGAKLAGSTEWDVENYYTLTKDITINLYNLNGGASVWGTRKSDYTVTVNMVNCEDAHEVLFNYGSGNGKVIVTVKNSTFLKSGGAAHGWPVSINCLGSLTVERCTFDGVITGVVVNVKQPAGDSNRTMTVSVKNSTFNNVTGQDGNKGALRVTGQQECDIDLTIANVEFTGSHAEPEDITIGNVEPAKNLGKVSYEISGTDASMTVHKTGETEAAKETIESSKSYTGNNLGDETPAGYVEDANGNVTISDEDGLFWFAKQVNEVGNTFNGKTVALANNIALTKTWEPIGDFKGTAFKGTFDGGNHTVSGVHVTEYSTNGVGFFAKTFIATIKNLTVEGTINAHGCNYVGGIVGHGYATITNCTFKGTITNAGGFQIGGIAGSGGFTVSNCSVYGDISGEGWVGGIAGNVQDGGAYTNCYVEGTISAEKAYYGVSAAGIAAIPLYKSQVISGCYCNANVKCGGEEINAPIIGGYNGDNNITADTELFIQDNSWNKQKNPNDSYEISENGTVIKGKTASRDNNLIMLEDDLKYVTGDLSKVRIMAGSAVTQEQVDALAVASIGNVKYTSLQAAIDVTPRNGTVKLLADTRENVTIGTPYVTLDLNGHTLNGSTGERKPALTVTARVTVKDSSEAQTGTIMREDTAKNSGVSSHYVIDVQGSGWLTFESGKVTNGSGNVEGKGASLVRVGDDSVSKFPGLNIKGGTFTQDNFIVIKVDRGDLFLNGGTLNSKNSYAIENWHRATIKGGTVNGAVSSWTYGAGSNSTLEIKGGTVNGNVEAVSYDGAEGKLAKVEIKGGTVNGTLSTKRYDDSTTDPAKATIEVTAGTFSHDPSEYLVEGSTVTKNSDGTFGVEKAYLAQVGENSYYTMDEAFKAQTASGKPIVLLRDYTTGSTFSSGSINRTVNLDGHTWTYTGTGVNDAAFEINYSDATLTVKNGNVVTNSMLGLIPSAMGGTITYDNAGLVFDTVTATANGHSGIETNGNNTNDSVTLRNSTLNVPNGFGIYFPSSGTLTIDNSTINAKTMGVQVCAGSLSINEGSAITVSDGPVDKTENDGAIQDGAAISIVNRKGYKGLVDVTITGGTFKANGTNAAVKAYDWENNKETNFTEPTKVSISGGTFSAEVPADLCAPGYVPVENSDGTYGVKKGTYVAAIGEKKYATLAAAVDAAKDGDTVTLLANVTENVEISKGKRVTLDLNGYTLNGGTGTAKAALTNYGTITIKDSSAAKTGTIKRDDNGTVGETSYYVIRNQGTMTIESGTVINNSGYRKANSTGSMVGSSLICNGDCDEGGTLTINGGTFTQNNFIAIKNGALGVLYVTGGTITSNHSAIQNWFKADITGGEIKGQLWTDAWKEGESVGETQIGGDAKFTGEIVMDITGSVAPTLAINGGNLDVTNWRITSAAANAGAKPAVSGGTFSSAVKEEYCATGYVPVDNGDGTYGVKAAAYVAEYNGTKYESLQEAIDTASQKNGGQPEVTLLTDVTITETVVFAKVFDAGSVLLNLGGYTLTGNGCRAIQVNKGNLYLEKGTVTSTGIINSSSVIRIGSNEEAYSGASALLYMRNGAKVLAPVSYGVTIFGSKTVSEKLTVAGNASIEATGDSPAISGNGGKEYNKDKATIVTITGTAKVSATNNYAIYHPDNGTLNIQSTATISGKGGIQMCSGTLNISGSPKIEALGKADHETGAAGPIYDNAAISAVNRSYPGGAPVVTIKGTPTITNEYADGEVIHAFTWSNKTESEWAEAGNNINVSGGTYSKTFNKSYLAEGCTLEAKDTMFTVKQKPVAEYNGAQYTSLAQALLDARNSGTAATVKLLENVTVTNNLDISSAAGITLNLNKKTLTLDGAQLYTSGSAIINNGTIKRTDVPATGNAGSFAIQVMSGSSLIIGSGNSYTNKVTLEAKYGIYNAGGTLNVRYATITTEEWSIAVTDSSSKTGEVIIGGESNSNQWTKITSTNGNCIGTLVNTKPNVTINGGTLTSNGTGEYAGPIYWASEGTLAISGGVFNANSAEDSTAAAVYQKNGTVKISNTPANTPKLLGKYALVVKAGEGSTGTMVTELSAGTYSTKPDDSWVVEGKVVHEKDGLYVVEGEYVVEATLADGTIKSFDSWDKLASVWNETGATIKLLKDASTANLVAPNGKLTIDFNGKTLTVTKDSSSNAKLEAAIVVQAGGELTLKDSVGNGGLTTTNVYGVEVITGSKLTIESGNYNCFTSAVQVDNGTAYIKGGTFKTDDADKRYLLNCIDEAFKAGTAVMEVTGGTFYGFDPSANPEGEGTTYVKVGYESVDNKNGTYTVDKISTEASYIDANGKLHLGQLKDLLYLSDSKGMKLTIYKDIEIDYVVLLNDRELNLNGHTLTVKDTFVAVTGSVKDTEDGKGLIKIAAKNLHLAPENGNVGQIPLYDAEKGGYRLFNCEMVDMKTGDAASGSLTIYFTPKFTNKEAYDLLLSKNAHNAKITITIRWTSIKGPGEQSFTFDQDLVDKVVGKNNVYNGGNQVFFITLTGLDADLLGTISGLKSQSGITSGTGASFSGVELSLN